MVQVHDTLNALPGGWSAQHIAILEEELRAAQEKGESLRPAFERTALRTGRKPNSIRNYYYTAYRAAKGQRTGRTFETFTQQEVYDLLRFMLQAQAEGKSVRRAAMELGNFDHSAMLRCQNKYRSLVKNRPEVVRRVIEELRSQGKSVYDPYASGRAAGHSMDADEQQVEKVLEGIWNDLQSKLSKLPARRALAVAQGIQAIFDGTAPQESSLVRENDRLHRENVGLVRQLEMIRMPIDGDLLADGGMHAARRAAQQAELYQNTAQEFAAFIPKNEENTK